MGSGNSGSEKNVDNGESRPSVTSREVSNDILPADNVSMSLKVIDFGIRASYVILGFMFLVLIGVIVYLLVSMSYLTVPSLTEESFKVYKDARSMILDEAMKIGDQFLLKLLLPVLTLLLGYIFGRERK